MNIAIRISGKVELSRSIEETLSRLHLHTKYAAVLMPQNSSSEKLLRSIRNFIAYGTLNKDVLAELLQKRAPLIDKNKTINSAEAAELLFAGKASLQQLNMRPFFRLHPPRRGIDSKLHFGVKKGVLGDNGEKINDLVRRML